MIDCNADLGHPCDADNGEPCPSCKQNEAYYRDLYERASPAQRDDARAAYDPEFAHHQRKNYREEMIAAGRGHLLRDDE